MLLMPGKADRYDVKIELTLREALFMNNKLTKKAQFIIAPAFPDIFKKFSRIYFLVYPFFSCYAPITPVFTSPARL